MICSINAVRSPNTQTFVILPAAMVNMATPAYSIRRPVGACSNRTPSWAPNRSGAPSPEQTCEQAGAALPLNILLVIILRFPESWSGLNSCGNSPLVTPGLVFRRFRGTRENQLIIIMGKNHGSELSTNIRSLPIQLGVEFARIVVPLALSSSMPAPFNALCAVLFTS